MNAKHLSIVVIGASGDLARGKIYPALFSLYAQGLLPPDTNIFGFSRTKFSASEFRTAVESKLTCRYTPEKNCGEKQLAFLSHCHYHSGQYDSATSFLDLYQQMRKLESVEDTNRLYYLSIPPSVFLEVTRALGDADLIACSPPESWSRIVIEKPFGRDSQTATELTDGIDKVVCESDVYRIDHYLGKEAIQNLMALRFANLIFSSIWNNNCIDHVCIDWKERIGVKNRAGYFNDYGIIRDVVQNHLLQILALIAMELPASYDSHDIRNEKVKVLKCIAPPELKDVRLGQYIGNDSGHPGYRDENGVPNDSKTPTYAAVKLQVANERWRGVPFLITAGKGLDDSSTEVRIHFKDLPDNIFRDTSPDLPHNQLTIRVQPDDAIYLNFNTKKPGLSSGIIGASLDFVYKSAFNDVVPEAYERLLLDVIRGDKTHFIRADELAAAWEIFTPVLHTIDRAHIEPEKYKFGAESPPFGEISLENNTV